MLASELRMGELLEFLPEQGKILLKGSRVIIFDAASMGKLRKDLIDTLGMERAKGFLIRYGWSCGFEAARNIKKQFQWDEEGEGIFSGPIMHTLQGFTSSRLYYETDQKTGKGVYYGYWTNSFEAEQHIRHFGYHHEPVCWLLVGYASGYSSARLGKRHIYKEIKCAGRGDERCAYIGKTVEDWGEEIIPELAYYEVSKISEELEVAHNRIKAQNKILEKTLAVHEQLTQCILNGKGVEDITATLAELMKCTVILEDRHLVPQSTWVIEQTGARELLTPLLPVANSPSFKKASDFYLQQKRPFQITDHFSGTTIYRLVSPIQIGCRFLGFVSLLRPERPFTDLENIALERAASVFALEILKKKEIAAVERRLKGDFIDDLLAGNFSDPNSIINRARGLDYDITLPHRVLVFEIYNFNQLVNSFRQDEVKILQFKTELTSTVESCLERFGKGMVVNRSANIITLVQLNKPDSPETAARQLAENIIKQVTRRFPKVTLTAGIGSCCTELAGFHHSFRSAQKAIEIGKALKKQGQVFSLEQFGAHALLFSSLNPKDLYRFAAGQIGSLLAYDETYKTQLIPTLQEFLNHRGNVERTARIMNMSVGGLKYRLQRIEEITGQDLTDAQACFNLHLALNILQMAGKDNLI